jgi:PBP1b-binding outer membrane lipoprotein LpoB
MLLVKEDITMKRLLSIIALLLTVAMLLWGCAGSVEPTNLNPSPVHHPTSNS